MSPGYYGSEAHKKAIREWAERNPEKMREYNRASYNRRKERNPKEFSARKIYRERKRVSIKNGVPFEVSYEYIMSLPHEVCPVFGVALEWGTGGDNTASLDRIIPSKGYVDGNVVWMSRRANTLKRDATREEINKICEWFNNVKT